MYAYSFVWKDLIEGKRSALLQRCFIHIDITVTTVFLVFVVPVFFIECHYAESPHSIPHSFNNGKFIIIAFANVANVWPHPPPEGAATRWPLQVELGWEQMQHTLLWFT